MTNMVDLRQFETMKMELGSPDDTCHNCPDHVASCKCPSQAEIERAIKLVKDLRLDRGIRFNANPSPVRSDFDQVINDAERAIEQRKTARNETT